MLKNVFITALFVVAFVGANAQEDTMRTVFKMSKPKSWGLYVAPEYQYGQAVGELTHWTGGSAMFILNQRFAIGASAMMMRDQSFSPKTVSPLYVRGGFGGLKMEYTVNPNSAVHVTFPLVIGAAMISADSTFERVYNDATDSTENHQHGRGQDGFRNQNADMHLIIQPGIHIEANLLQNVKLFAGANYRLGFRQENNSTVLATDAMNGFSISAGLKVGFFKAGFKLPKLPRFRRPFHRKRGEEHQ